MPITNDYVEYYPSRILLETDTQESKEHSVKHMFNRYKWAAWLPLTETWLVICQNKDMLN